jgi:hypothetical protein
VQPSETKYISSKQQAQEMVLHAPKMADIMSDICLPNNMNHVHPPTLVDRGIAHVETGWAIHGIHKDKFEITRKGHNMSQH